MPGGVHVRPDGAVEITGALTFQTVPDFLTLPAMDGGKGAVTVDLRGVTLADSAGVALLIEWMRQARASGRTLKFANVPEQVRHLIRVSGLTGIFNSP